MWQDILIITAVGIGLYSSFNCMYIIIRRILNSSRCSEKIYLFSGKVRYYPVVAIIIFLINIYLLYKSESKHINSSEMFFSINEITKINSNTNLIVLMLIVSILLIGDFILSIYVKPIMYEEGILCANGKFIPWYDINTIAAIKILNKRYILINNMSDKDIYLRINKRESNDIKEIMFNKSGIVSKEIVT